MPGYGVETMHRTVNGIAFRIISPSVWQFVDYAATLAFNGAEWVLSMEGKHRTFNTRDEAIDRVSQSMIMAG